MFNTPKETTTAILSGASPRINAKLSKIVIKGILAGIFIAIGASASSAATYGISNTGLAKTLAGVVFAVGLIMVIFMGAELFTGDCLLTMSCFNRRDKISKLIRLLIIVYISNLIGSLLVVFLVYYSGQLDMGSNMLAASTIKTAMGKVTKSPLACITSGIMCNVIVCAAVVLAGAAKEAAGKILAVFFAIFAFVISGYEHCVANMYYIPAGILAKTNEAYRAAASAAYGYTAADFEKLSLKGFFISNLLPVTIGNIIGGVVFIALPLYYVYIAGGND
jgi:formate/nitrite transporter